VARSASGGPPVADADAPAPRPLVPGVASALSPLVRRILAPNPGPMTGPGTNTYLVGIDEVAVIDPGPDDVAHLDAIAGCGGDRIRWILCTHAHPDHAPGAANLKKLTGADVLAFGPGNGLLVDRALADGDQVEATEFRLTAVYTPGHAPDHLCYYLEEERMLFAGDHVMEGSTVVIAPPEGDMAAYIESLERLRGRRMRSIAPGHGHLIEDPKAAIAAYIAHRLDRERQVLEALAAEAPTTTERLVEIVYEGLAPELVPWAARSVHAHLLKLHAEGRATSPTPGDLGAPWRPA